MEPPPSHFFDYLDLDDPNPYQSPEQEDNTGAICLNPFNPYGKDINGALTPPDSKDMIPRADIWECFPEQAEPLAAEDQKQLFVDPELYSPGSSNDEMRPQIQVDTSGLPQPSARHNPTAKSPSQGGFIPVNALTPFTPPEQEPPKKRKTRRTKRESNTAEEAQKRNKFLERNRVAASKCREKKKQYVSELEATKMDLELRNAHLKVEVDSLVAEIGALKHRLMAHAKCNDPNIDRWLNNEARKFVQTESGPFGQPFMPFGQVSQPELSMGSPRSRNPSVASIASIASSYPSLQGLSFDGLVSGERHGSIAYSQGESWPIAPPGTESDGLMPGSGSLYPSPTEETFPGISPVLKTEPDVNYTPMPDQMFSPGHSNFSGGS
ncbi:hypothetical protein P885DRAFT_34863 [Corynascus similis CBS 632.67]